MRVGIYAWVSTKDQTCELQVRDLRTYFAARGFELVREYVDVGQSGAKDSRPELPPDKSRSKVTSEWPTARTQSRHPLQNVVRCTAKCRKTEVSGGTFRANRRINHRLAFCLNSSPPRANSSPPSEAARTPRPSRPLC